MEPINKLRRQRRSVSIANNSPLCTWNNLQHWLKNKDKSTASMGGRRADRWVIAIDWFCLLVGSHRRHFTWLSNNVNRNKQYPLGLIWLIAWTVPVTAFSITLETLEWTNHRKWRSFQNSLATNWFLWHAFRVDIGPESDAGCASANCNIALDSLQNGKQKTIQL